MSFGRKKFKYKGVSVNIFGVPNFNSSNDNKKDFGKIPKRIYLKSFIHDFKKGSLKNLIVMYDIPHKHKKERDWFRRHLIKFGYVMIQKSVWVGPSPLPGDFIQYVKSIGLKKNLKTFKLATPYTGKENVF